MELPGFENAHTVMRSHMEEEWRAGFPRLKYIPCANVVRWLDYFATLEDTGKESLIRSLATLAAMRFYSPALVHDEMLRLIDSHPALRSWQQAARSPEFSMGLRYEGIRMRKAMLSDPESMQMLAQTRASLNFTPRDDMPPERCRIRMA